MSVLTSRENPKVKHWTLLARDARYRRTEKKALVEGPRLLAAALEHGCKVLSILATEEAAAQEEISRLVRKSGVRPALIAKGLFHGLVDAETPPGVAAEIAIPEPLKREAMRAVFLEGVQDPSNVGAILRSSAAFGVQQVVLGEGCADPWSPKALRAGMGGHFSLQVDRTDDLAGDLDAFKGTVACTVPRGGIALREAPLERSWAWIFGGEGRGLSEETIQRADLTVSIPMAPGTESLNVAAAAAICLYECFSRSGA